MLPLECVEHLVHLLAGDKLSLLVGETVYVTMSKSLARKIDWADTHEILPVHTLTVKRHLMLLMGPCEVRRTRVFLRSRMMVACDHTFGVFDVLRQVVHLDLGVCILSVTNRVLHLVAGVLLMGEELGQRIHSCSRFSRVYREKDLRIQTRFSMA